MDTNHLTSNSLKERTVKSQRYFNRVALYIYDAVVYGFVSRFLWGNSLSQLRLHYRENAGKRHLEVGVGTGVLVNNSSIDFDQLTLMDLSAACLHKSSERLSRYKPLSIQHNVLYPCDSLRAGKPYDSIAINYVMHCVPGDFTQKGVAFSHLSALLKEGGVLFGSTVLMHSDASVFAKWCNRALNALGIFNNHADTVLALKQSLDAHFDQVSIQIRGASVLFVAKHPIPSSIDNI